MLLELRGIEKHFGAVRALAGAEFSVAAGEVHALVGENGAGKSTLMKIVAGGLPSDGGEMRWRGEAVVFGRPADAHAAGISMVHQESLLAPHLTVTQNVFLGRERCAGPLLAQPAMERETAALIAEHGFPLDARERVSALSPAQRQLVEICRALHGASRLIIFDEPTSSLSEAETAEVFRIARRLKQRGMAIIYITHRLDELEQIADRVTILRDGKTVHQGRQADLSTDDVVQHMVGRKIASVYQRKSLPPGRERLSVDLPNIRFTLHAGEIVGLAGLAGAGRTELCQTIFGVTPAGEGTIAVDGRAVRLRSPVEAVGAGIALISEDRQRTGLALGLATASNITLANVDGVSRRGVIDQGRERAVARDYGRRLRIQGAEVQQPVARLSGGNQQKVVIAKWLFRDSGVFLFDEPTRGIDVGAKAEVFALMDELVRAGKAILMVSSELPELLQMADRILVMRDGALVAELGAPTTQQEIMRHAAVGG